MRRSKALIIVGTVVLVPLVVLTVWAQVQQFSQVIITTDWNGGPFGTAPLLLNSTRGPIAIDLNEVWRISVSGRGEGSSFCITSALESHLPSTLCSQVNRMTIRPSVTMLLDLSVMGRKQFVQPHPADPSKQIVYVSLEGPEAGTYIRGTAQLVDGAAVIQLPEHFSLVTNDEGLTVQLTPRGNCNGLYVEQVSTKQIVVKELMNGKSNVKFDYLIQGIRKGYENHQVIQDKAR